MELLSAFTGLSLPSEGPIGVLLTLSGLFAIEAGVFPITLVEEVLAKPTC